MEQHPIGYREIDNNYLVPLCERIIGKISEERIKRLNQWTQKCLKYLNKRNWFNNNIWFLDFEDYTREQVQSDDFEFSVFDSFELALWRGREQAKYWQDELMEACQVVYTTGKNGMTGKTLLCLEVYNKMLKFVQKECD